MRKTLIGIGIGALLMISGVSYAATVSYGTGEIVTYGTGGTVSFGAPSGTLNAVNAALPVPTIPCIDNSVKLNNIVNDGVTWIRYDVAWASVQSTSSASYVWGPFDCEVNDANAKGLNSMPILDYAPQWAAKAPCVINTGPYSQCAPNDVNQFITYCGAAATHFVGRVHAFEIWNEPNLNQYWGPTSDVAAYTQALIGCYNAIKAVDPTIQVVGGAMSGGDVNGTFLNGIYSNGGGGHFDILSMHPYTYPESITNGASDWRGVAIARTTMVNNGDSAKPIWITEYGAPTCGSGVATGLNPPSFGANDYLTQAALKQLVGQAIVAVKAQTYIGKFFWFAEADSNTTNFCFGLRYFNGQPKPALEPYRNN